MNRRTGLDELGVTHVGELSSEATALLGSIADIMNLPDEHYLVMSDAHVGTAVATEIERRVVDVLTPFVGERFPAHRIVTARICSIGAGSPGRSLHQEPTITDERTDRSVILWVALDDARAGRGSLRVIPGSHRWSGRIRPTGSVEATMTGQRALGPLSVVLDSTAGWVTALDGAVVHGTDDNMGRAPRRIAIATLVPIEAPVIRFHGSPPAGEVIDPPSGPYEAWDAAIEPTDVRPPLEVPVAGSAALGVQSRRRSRAAMPKKPGVLRALIDDGAAGSLTDLFGSISGWTGKGWECHLDTLDPERLQRSSTQISEVLDPVIESTLRGWHPFAHHFECAWPGVSNDRPLGRSWTVTDEAVGQRSLVLRLLVSGGTQDARLHFGTADEPWSPRGTRLERPSLAAGGGGSIQQVRLRVGDAVVSGAERPYAIDTNHGHRPAVWAVVALRPDGTPTSYLRRWDTTNAVRYLVDDHFWAATPRSLLADTAPLAPIAARLHVP